jgi:hypothetical protein
VRVIDLAPGEELSGTPDAWPAGLFAVARGEVEFVCGGGARARFGEGELVWLRGIGLRAVRNVGRAWAELVGISPPPTDPARGSSPRRHADPPR